MNKNPYETLGIDKDASAADIKLAYRNLAKKHHPDLNPGNKNADEKFKELNAANDILSDPDKRAAFDRGEIDVSGQSQSQPQRPNYRDFADAPHNGRYNFNGGDFDLSDIEDLFGHMGRRTAGAGFTRPPAADAHYTLDIDFLEAARGAQKHITLPDGKTLDLAIPEGLEEGQQLRLKGQGLHPSGDAYVKVHIRPHPFFTRKSKDITIELPITLYECLLGSKIQVPTLKEPVEMAIPKGARSDLMLRLKGKGIKGGDQYVKLKVVMPKEIDADLETFIRKWSETHAYHPRKDMEGNS